MNPGRSALFRYLRHPCNGVGGRGQRHGALRPGAYAVLLTSSYRRRMLPESVRFGGEGLIVPRFLRGWRFCTCRFA